MLKKTSKLNLVKEIRFTIRAIIDEAPSGLRDCVIGAFYPRENENKSLFT